MFNILYYISFVTLSGRHKGLCLRCRSFRTNSWSLYFPWWTCKHSIRLFESTESNNDYFQHYKHISNIEPLNVIQFNFCKIVNKSFIEILSEMLGNYFTIYTLKPAYFENISKLSISLGFALHTLTLQYRRFCLLPTSWAWATWAAVSFCVEPNLSTLLKIFPEGI